MLVAEYYAAAFCLCMVCLSSERSVLTGVLWSLGVCLLGNRSRPISYIDDAIIITQGSPVCCTYTAIRIWRYKHASLFPFGQTSERERLLP